MAARRSKQKRPQKRRVAKGAGGRPSLSPSQAEVHRALVAALRFARLIAVWGSSGFGKTTILRELRADRFPRAPIISTADFLAAMRDRHPLALEETYCEMLRRALAAHDVVLVDDLHLLSDVVCCSYGYPRKDYFDGPLTAVVVEALEAGKTLVVATRGFAPSPIHERCYYYGVKQLAPKDYAHIAGAYLPKEVAARIDFAKIFRFAPKLNGYQLRASAEELALEAALDTQRFIDYVRLRRMASNVDLSEVQPVDLGSLKGLDDVIEALEANVVLPFENDKLATEMKIKPKRGVLLIGPPGTGKTTVGRALAHRLKSKFFLVDGTIISGTRDFYSKILQVAEEAKRNAPSIIFIDDSDVIFEQGREQGLYRYLLTMLDGIESETVEQVCVMMTAMDVGNLPPALVRSGRIELWLETRLPDKAARAAILKELVTALPESIPQPEVALIAERTEGLTGADIKRLVEDGKLLFAFDKAKGREIRPVTDYFVLATEAVRANKARYAEAEARVRDAAAKRPHDPYDDYGGTEEDATPA